MEHKGTGGRIVVHAVGPDGPHLLVSPALLDALRRLLDDNGVTYQVEQVLHDDNQPIASVLNLGHDAYVERVQQILDNAE